MGVYYLLREARRKGRTSFFDKAQKEDKPKARGQNQSRYRIIMDASLLLSRYCSNEKQNAEPKMPPYIYDIYAKTTQAIGDYRSEPLPGPEMQRTFLSCLLVSPRPDIGLELLKQQKILDELWPELSGLNDVDHSKEFHPEGNVWKHTLETFRHRKTTTSGSFDLRLSLALLLHDLGKPISASFGNHRFDGHAELGAKAAGRFLRRLGFEDSLIRDIFYLVRNHMLPAALKRLPLSKTAEIMASPLFPTLLELYRCDESSSFKGLDGYYENSAAYQSYLKNLKNPYRSADGKKIKKMSLCHQLN
jgi:poly(A) polymerase